MANCVIRVGVLDNYALAYKRAWERADWIIVLLLFVGLASLYYATTSGISSSNDGSHYALTRTMVENRAFTLNAFDDYAEGNDIAITEDGRLFSDRPPGTALLSTLFYVAGGWLPRPLPPLPSRHDPENPRLAFVMLLPALAGAGVVVLLYAFQRELAVSRAAALTACLMFALGTVQWKYSSVLFSHALSGLLVISSLFLAVRLGQRPSRWWAYLLLGGLLGFAVLVEYSNGLLVVLVSFYLLWGLRPFTAQRLFTTIVPFVVGGLFSAVFLAFYNTVNFGGPFTLSYAYAVNYPWAGQFGSTFSYPLAAGLKALLYFGEGGGWCDPTCYNQGLLLLSPVLVVALPGWLLFWRQERQVCLLTTTVFLLYLLLFGKHFTSHGFTGDGRYLVPFLGLLVLPLGFALDWLLTLKRPVLQAMLQLIVYGLFFLSVRNIFLHIGTSYNYNLDLAQLNVLVANPLNWHYLLSQVFRNSINLPLLWAVIGLGMAIMILIWGVYSWWKERSMIIGR